MGPETGPKHLEQDNRYTVALTVRGQEKQITGTFREIQILKVIDSARKKGKIVLEENLRELNGSQFNRDIRLLEKNLNNHGVAIVSSGKRGTREYSWEEIPTEEEPPTENSTPIPLDNQKAPTNTPIVVVEQKSLEEDSTTQNESPPPAQLLPNRQNRDIPPQRFPLRNRPTNRNDNEIYSGTNVLSEEEKNRRIRELEIELTWMAVSRLMTKDGLQKVSSSPIELLKKVAPKDMNLESLSLVGIGSQAELNEYFIECVEMTIDRVWKTKNPAILSEKEQQILDTLTYLSTRGYDNTKIVWILRILFSIPAPTPARAAFDAAQAQAQIR